MKINNILLLAFVLLAQCLAAQTPSSVTFKVCSVKNATEPLNTTPTAEILTTLMNKKSEQLAESAVKNPVLLCSSVAKNHEMIPTYINPFVAAVYHAYAEHRPLVISPDMIWLLIEQGFTRHVKENSESLRNVFVDHAGQINLDVERVTYQPHSRAYWEGIFPDFSKAIAKNTKTAVANWAVPHFSTTTIVEKAAFEVTLMDAMSPYFTYSVSISCGIPSITLEGTTKDWQEIEERILTLEKYDLAWWADDLLDILKEFKAASEGKENKGFWKDIFVEHRVNVICGSEPYYTGWVFKLFPYLQSEELKDGEIQYLKNSEVFGNTKTEKATNEKISLKNIPSGLSKAKVLLNDNGAMTMLNFYAGFVGFEQDEKTLALRPSIQWFITDLKIKPSAEELAKYEK